MATDLKSLRKDELIALLIKAVVNQKTDDVTAFSNELMDRIPDNAEPGLVLDAELQELAATEDKMLREILGPKYVGQPVEHPICPTCKGVKTWIGDCFICNHCDRRLCPDGGGNPIPGEFLQMDGGGVAFQEDVVPDGGDQMRITGGNPPECPKCHGGMMPDESVYRCVTCGHAVGSKSQIAGENFPTCPDCGALTVRNGAVYNCQNCGRVMGNH